MIRGVIFDVDGVLLNSMPVWENLGELYLNRLGVEAEKDLGETLFAMSLEEGAEYLISHYGLDKTPEEIVKEKGLLQISDSDALQKIVDEILAANQKSVDDYRNGKTNALGFLVGQCMKASKGKGNPAMMKEMLLSYLENQ